MRSINGAVLRSAFAMVLGFVLVLWPEAAITYLVITIGILFILPGLFAILSYFTRPKNENGEKPMFPIEAAGSVLFGAWLVIMPEFFVNILMYVLGALLVIAGVQQLVSLISARKWSNVPLGFYLMPALILITGVMILAYPFGAAANTFVIFGVASIFYGACELRRIVEDYPYFQVARMLYLKNLAVLNDMSFTLELEKMAIFLPDRKKLFQLIEGDKYGLNSRVEHEPDMRKEDTFSLIDAFLSNRNEEPEPKKEASFLFQPSVSSDYMFWSLSKEEEEKPSGEDAENRLRHHDLIDSFIKNDQQRMPGSGLEIREETSRAETPESVKDLDDEQSKSLEDSCLTETLARIYIKQKRYDKALQIIKNLSLKYPEKNVYFADQIRFLEKLIINTKK